MPDEFEIPVNYKGEELFFAASLISAGYSYKIIVEISGTKITYEPDEQRNFRALVQPSDVQNEDQIDKNLVGEVGKTLQSIFGNNQ